jgi:hypothetical protein
MRDIRNDLRERIAAVSSRYAEAMGDYEQQRDALEGGHRKLIAELDRERAALQQMLTIEEQRDGLPTTGTKRPARLVSLADFMVTKIHAHGPLDKDQLRAEADLAGYFSDGEGDGRTFHTTLMNITKGGRLIRLPDGRYAFPERKAGALFGMGEPTKEDGMKTLM